MRFVSVSILILLTGFKSICQEYQIMVQTGHSATITALDFSPDSHYLASGSVDTNIALWNILNGKQVNQFSGHADKVNALSFHPSRDLLASASDDGTVIIWEYPSGRISRIIDEIGQPVKSVVFHPNNRDLICGSDKIYIFGIDDDQSSKSLSYSARDFYNALSLSTDGELLAFGGIKDRVRVIDYQDLSIEKTISFKPLSLSFSPNKDYLYGGNRIGQLRRWAINAKKSIFSNYQITGNRIWHSFNSVTVSDQYFVGANKNTLISVYDHRRGRKVWQKTDHDDAVFILGINDDNSVMASAGADKVINTWDLSQGELISGIRGISNRINSISFSNSGTEIAIGYDNGEFRFADLENHGATLKNAIVPTKWKRFFNWEYTVDDMQFVSNDTIMMSATLRKRHKRKSGYTAIIENSLLWDLKNNQYSVEKMSRRLYTRGVDPNEVNLKIDSIKSKKPNLIQRIALTLRGKHSRILHSDKPLEAIIREKTLIIKDTLTNKVLLEIETGHTNKLTTAHFNPSYDIIATGSWDGLIKFWDVNTGENTLILNFSGDGDFIYITPENYYFATKGALRGINFLKEDKIFSFQQFDLRNNRPDKTLDALPWIDQMLIDQYENAYSKRLEKLGIDSASLELSEEVPTVSCDLPDIRVTPDASFNLTFKAIDESDTLSRFHFTINGVPLFGVEGLDVGNYSYPEWSTSISVELNAGLNNIEYFVTNSSGISSPRESFQLRSTRKVKPDLYLLTLGISEFEQSGFNLNFADKDAVDINQMFGELDYYNQVHKKLFLNQSLTLDNLSEMESFIRQAGVDDVVIISISGHGLLDNDRNYYLSTFDMNFQNPAEKGLPYNQLEALLTLSKSRKKVLFIDACHSGELDISGFSASVDDLKNDEKRGAIAISESSTRMQEVFELSKALFSDLNVNNGARIISAAGGAEYALEKPEWGNGAFSYVMINGLRKNKADLNRDGKIMVSELQRYLYQEVPIITEGVQTPTSRIENLSYDFRIK